jgi:hypothetical protein
MGMRTPHADDLFCKPGFVHAQQRSRGLPPASDAGRPVEQLGRVCALGNMYTGVSPSRRLREYLDILRVPRQRLSGAWGWLALLVQMRSRAED